MLPPPEESLEEVKDDGGPDVVQASDPLSKNSEGKLQLRRTLNLRGFEPVPDVEWWDAAFLPPQVEPLDSAEVEPPRTFPLTDLEDNDIYLDKITHYVQHPRKLRNEYIENINKMTIPIHLTDKEKKRLKHLKRVEKEKDKQEKIKLGLMPAPLPKVKLSNFMKIMSKEAIQDPSRVE
jgi:U4/U6 small nuclear ribonucleoprotein PRP3